MMTNRTIRSMRLRSRSMTGMHPRTFRRRGVTLSEVLVSLLVMSIGVVAVATLFPLSVLRTVQATQLTNAAQLRYNFEGMAGARPEIFAGTQAWQPGKQYAVGDLIVGSTPESKYYECTAGGTSGSLEPSWPNVGQTRTDGGVTWTGRYSRVFVVDPLGWQNRTEDMRDLMQTPSVGTANIRNAFGRTTLATANNTVVNPNAPPYDSAYRIVRYRGGIPNATATVNFNPSSSTFMPNISTAPGRDQDIAARIGARQMAVLPDSWVVQTDTTEFTPLTVTTLQLNNPQSSLISTLDRNNDNTIDFTVTSATAAERDISARVTLYDITGKVSHLRQLTTITGTPGVTETLTWTGALPAGFIPARARVETFEARYSWMLTGRRNGPTAYMNLVVFFRRSTDPVDELIHPAHFNLNPWAGANNTVGNNDDVADLTISPLGVITPVLKAGADSTLNTPDDITPRPLVVIRYNADIGVDERPFLKKGGFICDSQNNRWYRILKFTEVANAAAAQAVLHAASGSALPAGRGAVVWLDNPILENSGIYNSDPNASEPESFPGAILMPGVIDVYPLQPRLPWEN